MPQERQEAQQKMDLHQEHRKIFLITTAVVCISYLIAIGIAGWLNFGELENRSRKNSLSLTQGLPNIFDNALNGPLAVVRRATREQELQQLLEQGTDLSPEEEGAMWAAYLGKLKEIHGFASVELVHEANQRYFTANGFKNEINLDKVPHDIWYVRFREEGHKQMIALDTSEVNNYQWTIYVTEAITDKNGNFAGVLSVGVSFQKIRDLLRSVEERNMVQISLLDPWKKLQLRETLEPLPPETLSLLEKNQGMDHYMAETSDGFLIVQRLEQLNWYLQISHHNQTNRSHIFGLMRKSLYGLLVTGLLTLLVLRFTMGRRQERLVQEATARITDMEDASKAKSSFLANMSHEIRTPINTIIGLNTMTLRRSTDETVRGYARDIQRASNVLLSLINDILDMSKIESGRMDIVPEEYDLAVLLTDVTDMARTKAAGKPLEISIKADASLPRRLVGDDVRIRQVLTNLLTNAVKYSDEGFVTLEVGWHPQLDGSALLTMGVRDTGIGLKPEDLARITEKFIRFDIHKNRLVEGTGLGMTITSRLLELMQSSLEAESVYGEGSWFHFNLHQQVADDTPIGDINELRAALAKEETEYRTLFTAPEAKILVADDNNMNLKVFCQLLSDTQVQITTCGHGGELVEKTLEEKYDLIYTDQMMPVMDGVEAFKAIRGNADNPNVATPVVILTANAIAGAKEKFLAEGFDGYLSKPIDAALLEKATADLLPRALLQPGKIISRQCGCEDEHNHSAGFADEWPAVEGFNFPAAARLARTEQLLLTILQDFHDSAPGEADKLEDCFNTREDGLEPYRIQVHAMKSNAATAGALGVSLMARMLEQAAAEGNSALIDDLHRHFLLQWRALPERLEELESIKPAASAAAGSIGHGLDAALMNEALERIAAYMKDFATDEALELLQRLQEYEHPPEVRSLLEQLGQRINDFDDDGAVELVEKLKA